MLTLFKKYLPLLALALLSVNALAQKNDAILSTEQVQKAIERGAILWDVRDEKVICVDIFPGQLTLAK